MDCIIKEMKQWKEIDNMVTILGYKMPDYAGEHYKKFINCKNKYLENKNSETSADMKCAYEDFKLEMHNGSITEEAFYRCKKQLNNGL